MIELVKARPAPDPFQALEEAPLPAERLEAEICSLAGHIAAATCRFLALIADYDERQGWASWDMSSCAAWLSWKVQLSPGAAREHVRVARALRTLPVIRGEFAAGRMSYSKARALTRIATADNEAGLAQVTSAMTASQVDRFVAAYHQCAENEDRPDGPPVPRRSLRWRFDQDSGEMSLTVHLPPADGAVVLQALRAALGDLEHPHKKVPDIRPEEFARPEEFKVPAEDLADALVEVSGNYLRGKIVTADNADIYQVIVHTTPDVLNRTAPGNVPAGTRGVSAQTPIDRPGHPARPDRCHLEDGPAISPVAAQLIACDAMVSEMVHELDDEGTILNVGRRRRRATAAMRRAVRERDGARCSFPGCDSRRTDLHHMIWWSMGGETSLENLQPLCRRHHGLVHQKGYVVTRDRDGGYMFTRPDGLVMGPPPALPGSAGDIGGTHQATITDRTIQQAAGERLDLHYAIWVALHNGRSPAIKHPAHRFYRISGQQAA